jgi:hypothetical protein
VLDVDAAVPAVGAHPCQRGTANLLRGRGRAVPAPARVQHVQRGIRIQAIRGIEDPGRIRGHPVGVDVAVDFTARRGGRGDPGPHQSLQADQHSDVVLGVVAVPSRLVTLRPDPVPVTPAP